MERIEFRPLAACDFPLLHKWMNTDTVLQWYGKKPVTLEQVSEKYQRYISGEKPTRAFLFLIENTEVGYLQTYRIIDYPEYNLYVETDGQSAGIDLFIGETKYLHKGYGPNVLKEFLRSHVFCNADISRCIIGPEPDNLSAIRAYQKAGFQYYKTIQLPDEDAPEFLMKLTRARFTSLFPEGSL